MSNSSGSVSCERAQSSTLGVALILGITLTAATAMLFLGGNVIQDGLADSHTGQAEHAITQFNSKAAQVALGESSSQTVSLGGNDGTYRVDEDAGEIRILHEEWNGDEYEDYDEHAGDSNTEDNGRTTVIYEESLGTVIYEGEEAELAYQGGGVWRKDGEGASTMVSTPEFHYRGSTLTLPLVKVTGSDSATGRARAHVTRVETAQAIYPSGEQYPNGDPFQNPVTDGNTTIEVTSEYCEGWESYFRKRTDGEVTSCDDGMVRAELVAVGTQGEFDPTGGGNLDVVAFDEFINFEVTLRETGNSGMNNILWSMYGEEGDDQIEILMNPGNQNDCGDPADVVVYYSDDGGDNYHTWVNDQDFEFECPGGDDIEITIEFDSEVDMRYEEYEREQDLHFDAGTFADDETFDPGTAEETNYGSEHGNDEAPLPDVLEHYFHEMDRTIEFSISERQGGNNPASLSDSSSGDIRYEGDGESVTYLHVTENTIRVDLST